MYIIKSLLKSIIVCRTQGISLRGHRDDAPVPDNERRGNLGELVKFMIRADRDKTLADHLQRCPKNATYMSIKMYLLGKKYS